MSYRGKEYLGVCGGTTAEVLENKALNGKVQSTSGYPGVVRGRGFEPVGREFESLRARQLFQGPFRSHAEDYWTDRGDTDERPRRC